MVGIDRSDDILEAQKLALNLISNVNGVLTEPGCSITVDKLGDSNTTLLIRAWVDQTLHDLLRVRSEAIRQLKLGFDDANIVMPEPIYKLKISSEAHTHSAPASSFQPTTDKTSVPTASAELPKHKPAMKIGQPAQSVEAEHMIDKAIDAELEISDENLLSDTAAHE